MRNNSHAELLVGCVRNALFMVCKHVGIPPCDRKHVCVMFPGKGCGASEDHLNILLWTVKGTCNTKVDYAVLIQKRYLFTELIGHYQRQVNVTSRKCDVTN